MTATALEREYHLPALCELRIITPVNFTTLTRVLIRSSHNTESSQAGRITSSSAGADDGGVDGADDEAHAEVFGAELPPGVWITLPAGQSIPILTPTGCQVLVAGPPKVFQQVYSTMLGVTYTRSTVDLHTHLEYQRVQARKLGLEGVGPRVLVVGDQRCIGKSTLVQTLTNYAVRLGYHPILANLDVCCPRLGYPECLSVFNVQYPIDVEELATFVPGQHVMYGATDKKQNPALFLHGVRQLVGVTTERMARNDRCRIGGMFVDYGTIDRPLVEEEEQGEVALKSSMNAAKPGDHKGALGGSSNQVSQMDLLLETIIEAEVDHVFVVHSNWLRFKLIQRALEKYADQAAHPSSGPACASAKNIGAGLPGSISMKNGITLRVVQVDANTAVTSYSDEYLNRQRWLQYFFGTVTSPLKPALVSMSSASIRVIQVGNNTAGSMSMLLPMVDDDAPVKEDAAMLTYLRPEDLSLADRIVAVSPANAMEVLADGTKHSVPFIQLERRLKECFISGFARITSVEGELVRLITTGAPIVEERGLCVYPLQSTLESNTKK